MTRVLSGTALVVLAIVVVWFAPPMIFFLAAEVLLVLAFIEYSRLSAERVTRKLGGTGIVWP